MSIKQLKENTLKENFILFGIVLNIILYFLIVFMWLSIPDELLLCFATTSFNIFLSLLLVVLRREKLKVFYQSHQFKMLTETIINVTLIFFIISLLNYWSFKFPLQKDFSLYQLNTLTSQTKSILKKINGEVKFKILSRKNEMLLWQPIVDLYRVESSQIKVEKINIELRPDLVNQYHIQTDSVLVIEHNNKQQVVTARDELNITNALIRLTRQSDPIIYFLYGHGEAHLDSVENDGMQFILEAARNTALDIRPLNLLNSQEIPFDAKAVVVWGPKSSLMDNEVEILKRFYKRGGNLIVALDPNINEFKFKNLNIFLNEIGLNFSNNLIYDRKSFVNGSNGSVPIAAELLPDHPLTKGFTGQVFFPLVSSVSANQIEGAENKEIVFSSEFPYSWGETNKKEIASSSVSFSEKEDLQGPLSMVATSETDKNRVILYGNSTFALNAYIKFSANMSFFINSLSYAVGEDRLISFNLPVIQSEQVFISENQLGVVFYFSVVFAPLILIIVSIVVYKKRWTK